MVLQLIAVKELQLLIKLAGVKPSVGLSFNQLETVGWNRGAGQVLAGLIKCRKAESALL